MPVELRKRKAPEPVPAPAPAAKKEKAAAKQSKATAKAEAPAEKAAGKPPSVGDIVKLDGFGGEVQTHEGEKTTLKALVEESKAGVVLFTYPKAQTGGCIKQACAFRDSHSSLTATGLSVYGLSSDSPKANTNFKEKQSLPYPLLCDPQRTLIRAIGMGRTAGKTTRGVFVVDKEGKVLAAEAGGPLVTLEVAQAVLDDKESDEKAKEEGA